MHAINSDLEQWMAKGAPGSVGNPVVWPIHCQGNPFFPITACIESDLRLDAAIQKAWKEIRTRRQHLANGFSANES